tara:strand:- start:94 stop:477 length:384 start_codon:yes stop_codon:yes gene_type:complete
MVLTSIGKRFVYVSILFMALSMALPWESLSDYTYLESAGIMMNIIPAIIFIFAAALVILKPLAEFFNKLGTNYTFLLLCLLNAIALYFGMQYYPDTYTIGYILFPSSIIAFMLGAIFSIKRINGLQN